MAKKSVLEDTTNSTTAMSRAARKSPSRKAARLSSAVTVTSTATTTTVYGVKSNYLHETNDHRCPISYTYLITSKY